MELEIARELIQFINASPSCYHAADTAARMLSERGYARLWESQPWRLAPGCGYYVLRGAYQCIEDIGVEEQILIADS